MDPNFRREFPVPPQVYELSYKFPVMYNFMEVSPTPYPNPMLQVDSSPREQLQELHRHYLRSVWENQNCEMTCKKSHKQNHLPLSRIKKVMKSDSNVKMVSVEAPVLFSKACEYLIMELSLSSWLHASECRRETIEGCDISHAIGEAKELEFLRKLAPITEVPKVGFPYEFFDHGSIVTEPLHPVEPYKNSDMGIVKGQPGRSS